MTSEINFYQQIYPLLLLMPIVAAGFLSLVLAKGDVCPGQRKRIIENMISVWAVLAVGLMMGVEQYATLPTLIVGGCAVVVGILLNLVQAKQEGKRSIPSEWLKLPLALTFLTGVLLLWQQQSILLIFEGVLLGAVFAHVILLRAKHRLQAFNTLLPVAGIFTAIVLMLGVLVLAWLNGDAAQIDALSEFIVYRALILLAALGLWTVPLYTTQTYTPNIVSITTVLLLFSEVLSMGIITTL